jgi:hypothetical protein
VRGTVAERTGSIFAATAIDSIAPRQGDAMNRRAAAILVILAGVASIAAAAPVVASAAGPNTSMTVHVDFGAGTARWSSSGAVADEGSAAALYQKFGSPSGPSPQWTEREGIIFVGRAGSFTIRQQALFVDESPVLSFGTSHWIVIAGTGTYSSLRGHGTASIVGHWDAGTIDVALVGTLDFGDRMR